RIDFKCKDIAPDDNGYGYDYPMTNTMLEVHLKPGIAQFSVLPVVALHMVESMLWGDKQFVIDMPFEQARPVLQRHLQATCGMRQEYRREYGDRTCTPEQDAWWHRGGLYVSTGELGGTW